MNKRIRQRVCSKKMHAIEYNPELGGLGPTGLGWDCIRCKAFLFDPLAGWWDAKEGVLDLKTGEVMKEPEA